MSKEQAAEKEDRKDVLRDLVHIGAYLDKSGAPDTLINRLASVRAFIAAPQAEAGKEVPNPWAGWAGAAEWLRANYQDFGTIDSLCDAMLAAAPAATGAAPQRPQDERARFEVWARQNGFDCDYVAGKTEDRYIAADTIVAWEGWQAHASLSAERQEAEDWRDKAMKAAWPYIKDTPVADLFAAPASAEPNFAALQQRQAPAPIGDTQYFTAVFRVPKGWKPGPEIMESPYWSAGSWSHALDDRDAAIRRAQPAPAEPVSSRKIPPPNAAMLRWALRELLSTLPERRDWFNPDAEEILRDVLKDLASPAAHPATGEAMRECPDCEGSAKISANEWCARCDRSGILPGAVGGAAELPIVRPLDDPKMAEYLKGQPWIAAYIETLESELRKAGRPDALAAPSAAAISYWEGPTGDDGGPLAGALAGRWSEWQPTTLQHGKAIAERGDKDKRVKFLCDCAATPATQQEVKQ